MKQFNENWPAIIKRAIEKAVDNLALSKEEAIELSFVKDKKALYDGAHFLTRSFLGNAFDTCSIINVKCGACPEDCKWCAQSSHFSTGTDSYPLLDVSTCCDQAVYNRQQGIKRFSLVASGRGQSNSEIEKIAQIYEGIRKNTDIKCCASLGLLTEKQLSRLFQSGVTTYHCNLETAPRYFGKLVSTHSQEQKIRTIQNARRVGMRVCSGGIIGMGEDMEDRIDLALLLRQLEIYSIPINVLQPIAGTPLESTPPLTEEEYLTSVAVFRYVCPRAFLRFSGGRALIPIPTVKKAMYIGINAAITGDLLTTPGARSKEDMALIKEMEYLHELPSYWEIPE